MGGLWPRGLMETLATAKSESVSYKGWGSSFEKLKAKKPTCRTDPNRKLRIKSKFLCVTLPTSLFRHSPCLL